MNREINKLIWGMVAALVRPAPPVLHVPLPLPLNRSQGWTSIDGVSLVSLRLWFLSYCPDFVKHSCSVAIEHCFESMPLDFSGSTTGKFLLLDKDDSLR